ncbi:hypothetical protein NPIL_184281, partial [Nephila pilipes]
MENVASSLFIKHLFLNFNTPMQIKDELDAVFGDTVPSSTTIKLGQLNFSVTIPAWKTTNVRDVQKQQSL